MEKNSKKPESHIKPERILIIRTDRIGDVILTLPIADALKKHYPGAEIDFLVNLRTRDLLNEYPNINKVHTIEKVTAGGIKQICSENRYDLAIAVYPRFKIALGMYLAGTQWRLGTAYRWYSFLFNIKHHEHRKNSVKHELEYNLNLLQELGLEDIAPQTPQLNVSENLVLETKRILLEKGLDPEHGFIVIHVPTLGSAKVWSDANFRLLINNLLIDPDFKRKIVLTGTDEDKGHVSGICGGLLNRSRVIAVLDFDLNHLKALLKLADIFVGNSSGPIHIAAALGTFVVGLYSPVKVESALRWGPYTDRKKIFSPASDTDKRHVMDDIDPYDVYLYIKEHLSKI